MTRLTRPSPVLGMLAIATVTATLMGGAGSSSARASGASQGGMDLAQQVRTAEIAFAKTMADRDLAAFSTHVAEDAVFIAAGSTLRGRAAVAAGWAPMFEDTQAPFSWEPEQVEVLDSGALALSTGPVLDPEGTRVGTFISTWRLDDDGVWRVIFDKGCPPCGAPGQP